MRNSRLETLSCSLTCRSPQPTPAKRRCHVHMASNLGHPQQMEHGSPAAAEPLGPAGIGSNGHSGSGNSLAGSQPSDLSDAGGVTAMEVSCWVSIFAP